MWWTWLGLALAARPLAGRVEPELASAQLHPAAVVAGAAAGDAGTRAALAPRARPVLGRNRPGVLSAVPLDLHAGATGDQAGVGSCCCSAAGVRSAARASGRRTRCQVR